MPQIDSSRLKLGHGWFRGEDWWGDPMSQNMRMVDALSHPYVKSMTLNEPPALPVLGDQYIVSEQATGEWLSADNALATYTDKGWFFISAFEGLRVRVANPAGFYWWTGTSWLGEPVSVNADPLQGRRYDISVSVGYPPEPNETVLVLPIIQAMTLPANAIGSLATATNPPTSPVILSIMRNGIYVGTVLYTSSSFAGSFTVLSAVTFAMGDRLTVTMPNSVPETFRNFGMVLRMTLIE